MIESLDILAIAAHPDDAELLMGGTLARAASNGKRTGVLDLTTGAAGTKGDEATRLEEAARAASVLGLAVRENVGLPDAHLEATVLNRLQVAHWIRTFTPEILLIQHAGGRNPDHYAASTLCREAAYSAGLASLSGDAPPHRPRLILEAVSFLAVNPEVVIDISEVMETKIDSLRAYASQFDQAIEAGDILSNGISDLIEQVRFRNQAYGALVQAPYGEPYVLGHPIRFDSPLDILGRSL